MRLMSERDREKERVRDRDDIRKSKLATVRGRKKERGTRKGKSVRAFITSAVTSYER